MGWIVQVQNEIHRVPFYVTSRNAVQKSLICAIEKYKLKPFLNTAMSVTSVRLELEGKLFQAAGPEKQKPRSPNLVLSIGRHFEHFS